MYTCTNEPYSNETFDIYDPIYESGIIFEHDELFEPDDEDDVEQLDPLQCPGHEPEAEA